MSKNVYYFGIKKVLLDHIADAEKSVLIAMAWFTDKELKDALIIKKRETPSINIEIVVDPNLVNKSYFLDYKEKFDAAGIIIKKKEVKNFLHHKFMLIDGKTTITGSYNYSKKAQSNLEDITVLKSKKAYRILEKEFRAITTKDYEDENVKLLFSYPEFAQKLLSTHYEFSKTEYQRYKKKIVVGDCYTYPTGSYDKIYYAPGLIFNTALKFDIALKVDSDLKFKIPLSKEKLKSIITAHNDSNIIDSYRGHEKFYHEINETLKRNEEIVKRSFKKTLDNTFTIQKIKKLIEADIDLIIEDYFWISNFGPYLNKMHVRKLFDSFQDIKKFDKLEDYL